MKEHDTIVEIMKNPKSTDSQLAEALNISRSGAAKRRASLESRKELEFFAAPNLTKIPNKLISGTFGFNPSIAYKTVEKIAKKLMKDENFWIVSIRRTGNSEWGISFSYYNPESTSEKFTELIEQWRSQIVKEVGPEIKYNDISSSTIVFRMLGKDVQ